MAGLKSSNKLKVGNKQLADAKPSQAWLKKQKLRIVDTYVDPKSKKKKYVLADTFDS